MNTSPKLNAGSAFPSITVKTLDDTVLTLGKPRGDATWQMVVVYRGRHCPLCTKFLNHLEDIKERLAAIGIDLVAVSADSREQLQSHREKLFVSFTLTYGLPLEAMKTLGLYISVPRSEQETDHNFAEPGLFVVNEEGNIQVIDISNNPFVRPDIEALVSGLEWIRNPENNYPIRGTYSYGF